MESGDRTESTAKSYFFIITGGVLSGIIVFGGQVFANLGLSLYQMAILPLPFSMVLLPLIFLRKEYRLKREMLPIFLASGLVGAALVLAQYAALILGASVAVAALLLYTQPLWTTVFGRFFLQERVTKRKVLAIVFVLLGVIFLVNPFDLTVDGYIGPMVALVGGIFLSAWVILGRVSGNKGYAPVTVQFSYTLFTLIFLSASFPLVTLFIDAPSMTSFSFDLSASLWTYIGGYSVVSYMIPQLLVLKGVKRVPASDAGILMLSEPVVAAILAYLFLQQTAAMNIILGGALILFSNYLVVRSKDNQSIQRMGKRTLF